MNLFKRACFAVGLMSFIPVGHAGGGQVITIDAAATTLSEPSLLGLLAVGTVITIFFLGKRRK